MASKRASSKPKSGGKKSKRKTKKSGKGGSAFIAFLRSEKFAHVRGAVYVLFALFLVVALMSYYLTDCGTRERWLGSVGQGVAEFFAVNLFGIGSLGFALLFFVYGMRLWKVVVMPWWKTFGSTLFWMLWISVTIGYIGGVWVKSVNFEAYAGIGLRLAEPLHMWISWWTLVLLVFVAVLFLVLVHKMELPEVHMPSVNVKKAIQNIEDVVLDKQEDVVPAHHKDVAEVEPEVKVDPEEKVQSNEHSTFDDEAIRLFHTHRNDEEPQQEPAFNIDDEFARINRKAQTETSEGADSSTDDGVTFTIASVPETTQGVAPVVEELSEEELDPDDYRRHYGIDDPYDPHLDLADYIMPSTEMLEDWEVANVRVTKEELISNKDRIVQTLRDYGIEITDITATPGPTVTLYEIKPAPGVRISKIKNLEDDIALSLSALGIRIIAPIPGRGTVGIEVPNAKPQVVSMKTMLECDAFKNDTKMELPIALGKTISNEPFVADLAKMPHLLMAGATGTGKSVGLNAVITSLLYKKHPSELKFVLVDPKKVELSLYSSIERQYLAKMPDAEDAIITDVPQLAMYRDGYTLRPPQAGQSA